MNGLHLSQGSQLTATFRWEGSCLDVGIGSIGESTTEQQSGLLARLFQPCSRTWEWGRWDRDEKNKDKKEDKEEDKKEDKEGNKDDDKDSANNNNGHHDEDKDSDEDENDMPSGPWAVRTRWSLLFPANKQSLYLHKQHARKPGSYTRNSADQCKV